MVSQNSTLQRRVLMRNMEQIPHRGNRAHHDCFPAIGSMDTVRYTPDAVRGVLWVPEGRAHQLQEGMVGQGRGHCIHGAAESGRGKACTRQKILEFSPRRSQGTPGGFEGPRYFVPEWGSTAPSCSGRILEMATPQKHKLDQTIIKTDINKFDLVCITRMMFCFESC